MQSQKQQNNLGLFPSKPFNITVIQVYAPTSKAEEVEVEQFYEDLQDLLELTQALVNQAHQPTLLAGTCSLLYCYLVKNQDLGSVGISCSSPCDKEPPGVS